jgi:hypothetical protein
LLTVEEIRMHLDSMLEVSERRKEGAKKAIATRKKRKIGIIHVKVLAFT